MLRILIRFNNNKCSTRACWFYIVAYLSKDHSYSIYNIIKRSYKYTTPLYINCKEKYFATSEDYKSLKVAKLVY